MERERKSDPVRFRSLDAWRGICALCVAAYHLKTNGWINTSAIIHNAGRFVDFFFVLSGFVIAYAYRQRLEEGGWRSFLIRRFGRLWPLHIATLGVALAMAIAGGFLGLKNGPFDYSSLLSNITLTQAWGYPNRFSWNGPSWSISAEVFAYGLFALVATWLRTRRLDLTCAAIMLAAWAVLVFIQPLSFASVIDFSIPECLYGFMAGVLACRLHEQAGFAPRGELIAVILTGLTVAYLPVWADTATVPVFAWTVLVFASDAGWVSRALHRPLPQLLGRVSYSIYMDHYLIALTLLTGLKLFTGLTADVNGATTIVMARWAADLLTLAFLVAVVAVASLTYRWIERPGRNWFNARSEPVPAAW